MNKPLENVNHWDAKRLDQNSSQWPRHSVDAKKNGLALERKRSCPRAFQENEEEVLGISLPTKKG